MKHILTTLIMLGVMILTSCAVRYTEREWLQRMPSDPNRAAAQVVYETGISQANEKLEHQKEMDLIQRGAMVASGACIVAVLILAYLSMGKLAFIPLAVFAGCLWTITFVEMDSHYPKFLPVAGGVITLLFGGLAVYYFVVKQKVFGALKEVVVNNEDIKATADGKQPSLAAPDVYIRQILAQQSPFTKKLVAGIKQKIKDVKK